MNIGSGEEEGKDWEEKMRRKNRRGDQDGRRV
jgi:hypothetical protein